jgi:hypothetical protein
MKQQTAVQWFREKVFFKGSYTGEELRQLFNEALAMEKQQIECAFFDGDIFGADYYDPENPNADVSTNYYNQKYKSDE